MTRALAVLVVLPAIFFLSAGTASAARPYEPITYYVNVNAEGANNGTSWANAFTDLQDALDAAVSGDAIWVAAGTYTPSAHIKGSSDPRTAAFILKSGVAIYGGFAGSETALSERSSDPGLTVLSGDIGTAGVDTDNSYHVVFADGVIGAVLDGFTVTGGRATAGGWWSPDRDSCGGGMYTARSALTVSNCIFSNNEAWHDGGGMYNEESSLIVSDSVFSANTAGKYATDFIGRGGGMCNIGLYDESESSKVTGCTFENNRAQGSSSERRGGGGMYNEGCGPIVDGCTFERNFASTTGYFGGGMFNYRSWPTVTNCVFDGNWATKGGGMGNVGSTATVLNCTFFGNGWAHWPPGSGTLTAQTHFGGAIYEERTLSSKIIDVIFSGNAAVRDNSTDAKGGAVCAGETRSLTLTRCLFFDNVRWRPDTGSMIDHVALYSNFLFEETNNLYDENPLLADPENGDYHLLEGSPAIDTGLTPKDACFATVCWLPLPEPDFEGDSRVIDGDGVAGKAADIGADEYVPTLDELRALIQGLLDDDEIDGGSAIVLLDFVDDAQGALDGGYPDSAKSILEEMIDWLKALEDAEIRELILRKAEAVHGTFD